MEQNVTVNGQWTGMDSAERKIFPTLRNAPISEALIDIQVTLPPDIGLNELRGVYSRVEKTFPNIEEIFSIQAKIHVDQHGARLEAPQADPNGLLLTSGSQPERMQVRLNGFTFTRLRPYADWKSFKANCADFWNIYREIARPRSVVRLAVRYINRLELLPGRDLKDFILTVPEIAPGLPQALPDYLMRLIIPHESGSMAIVTQNTAPRSPDSGFYPVIFDVDVFRTVDFDPADPAIWVTFEELRYYKNDIFFSTLTPNFLETFK